MEFEWDSAKSDATFRHRVFDFAYASRIFASAWTANKDGRSDYGEVRMKAIGQVGSDVLVIIHTVRGKAIRIISALAANRKERAQWQSSG